MSESGEHVAGTADGPGETWLSLLVEDATVEDLRAHRDRVLREAHTAPERAGTEAEAALAETLHSRLAERRLQARNLAALNDLARRLASLHDTSAVLQEVVARSRQLLGVDVAYIMVRHDDGSLRIESADGSMGSALRGQVLSEGQGLGGQVVSTGRPMWSESYLADERLARGESLERAARSEQLEGILGVPLQVGGETIGVLLAAERRSRRFLEQEVELLAGLAAHAAVALRNAQIFGRYQQALDDLRSSNASLRELDVRRQRAAALRDRLTEIVLAGGGVSEVAAAIGEVVRAPVVVLDNDGRVLGAPQEGLVLPADLPRPEWFADARTVRRPATDGELAATVVALRGGYAGCVLVPGSPEVDDETVRLLEIGAVSVALVISSERVVAEAELRTRGELVHALLAPDVDAGSIRRRARAAGLDLDLLRCVAVLDPGAGDHRPAEALAARLASELRGWSAEHAGQIVLLVPRTEAAAVRARVVALGGDPLPAAIGIADCGGGVGEVRAAYEAARQTATLLLALGRGQAVAQPAELGVYRSLFSSAGRGQIADFVDATLGALLAQDRLRGRDLVTTVDVYLRQAQHHARTCAELHVHANTLYNRLERIEEVLGPDWRDPDRVLELQLALQLRRLAAVLASPSADPRSPVEETSEATRQA
ncbi:helix-turn-helix domain-containing protein [Nocardioides humi]